MYNRCYKKEVSIKTKNILVEIAISFALYWIFAAFIYFAPEIKNGLYNYYLFLPAGVKFFAVLIFGWRGAVGTGLAIFSRLILTDPLVPWYSWIIVSIASSLAMFLVVEWGLRLFKVERNLSNLKYYQIVVLATVTSVVNGFLFVYVVASLGIGQVSTEIFHNGIVVTMGNFAGNAVFVCTAVILLRQKTVILDYVNRFRH